MPVEPSSEIEKTGFAFFVIYFLLENWLFKNIVAFWRNLT